MPTVREEIFSIAARRGVGLLFGNPGSTELPLLAGSQDHLRYILCLHEAVAVGAAAGYSAISGLPSLVNLHTVAGLSNAMGAIATAQANRAAVVVTAGQQDTRHLRHEPLLSGPLVDIARPLVKWSHQPARAADVPTALERAFRIATAPPQGPVFLSLPMDYLEAGCDAVEVHDPAFGGALPAGAAGRIVERLVAARRPAMVTGAGVETAEAWHETVALAEALRLEVYAAPVASQFGFPTGHRLFRGQLGVAASQIRRALAEHDVVLVVGAPVFLLYPYTAVEFVPQGCEILLLTEDAGEAARLPTGEAFVAGLAATLCAMTAQVPHGAVARAGVADPAPAAPQDADQPSDGIGVRAVCQAVNRWNTAGTVLIDESVSSGAIVRRELPVSRPRTYLRSANGGLGTALPAGLGAQLARPDELVVVISGDGAAMYSIQALWTAAREGLAVKFVVLNNQRYKILADFHHQYHRQLGPAPGLEIPGIDFVALAQGMGVAATAVTHTGELDAAVDTAFGSTEPHLLEVRLSNATQSIFT